MENNSVAYVILNELLVNIERTYLKKEKLCMALSYAKYIKLSINNSFLVFIILYVVYHSLRLTCI